MERKINYVSGRDGALSIREFRGYGQSLSVLQGKSKLMIHVMPEDEELGIMIFHLQSPEEETTLRAPVVDIKNAKKVIQNMNDAIDFCKEFREREEEFKNAAFLFPVKQFFKR